VLEGAVHDVDGEQLAELVCCLLEGIGQRGQGALEDVTG